MHNVKRMKYVCEEDPASASSVRPKLLVCFPVVGLSDLVFLMGQAESSTALTDTCASQQHQAILPSFASFFLRWSFTSCMTLGGMFIFQNEGSHSQSLPWRGCLA